MNNQNHTPFQRTNPNDNIAPVRTQIPNANLVTIDNLVTKCHHGNCNLCDKLETGYKFNVRSSCVALNTHTHDNGRKQLNCRTMNVVYLISCKTCSVSYVGETQQKLSTRIQQHSYAILKNRNSGCKHVVEHFNNGHCTDFNVRILEACQFTGNFEKDKLNRLKRETYWICTLRSKYPHGLNEKLPGYVFDTPIIRSMIDREHGKKSKKNRGIRKGRSKRDRSDRSIQIMLYLNSITHKCALNEIYHIVNQCNKKTLHGMNTSLLVKPFKHERLHEITVDLIKSKLYRQPKIPEVKKKNPMMLVHYTNPGLDSVSISTAIKDASNYWPLNKNNYLVEHHKPSVIYSYDEPIRNTIVNHSKVINRYKHGSLNELSCQCKDEANEFKINGHVTTGNTKFVRNLALRKLIEKGPKYRLHKSTDISSCAASLRFGLEQYVDRLCYKLNKDTNDFKYWIDKICSNWVTRATNKTQTNRKQDHCESLSKKSLSALRWLQRNYVITLTDKASQNLSFICKKAYLQQVCKDLGVNPDSKTQFKDDVYKLCHMPETDIIKITSDYSNNLGVKVERHNQKLPFKYILPKFHKQPVKYRPIIASKSCTTKQVSHIVSLCLSKVLERRKKYCQSIYHSTGINTYWVIDNNKPILQTLSELSNKHLAGSVETYDFTSLYTTLHHQEILDNTFAIVDKCMPNNTNLLIAGDKAFWTSSNTSEVIDGVKLKSMIKFVVQNTYFRFGDLILRQSVGLPMGTDCAPQLANTMLHNMEHTYMMNELKTNGPSACKKLNLSFRYIDDITIINGYGDLDNKKHAIYGQNLYLEKVNRSWQRADILDISVNIETGRKFVTKTYDKRRSFNFKIINFPHYYGNVPSTMCLNVYGEQIHRHARLNTKVDDFIYNIIHLNASVSERGYNAFAIRDKCVSIIRNYSIHKQYKLTLTELINKLF